MQAFVTKFTSSIVAALSCFDRVLFKGYLPFSHEFGLERFVDYVLKMRRKDFLPFAEQQAEKLVAHAKQLAAQNHAPYEYLQGHQRKDELASAVVRERGLNEGLVAVFCVQETCSSFRLLYGQGRPRLVRKRRQQRVLYFYFLDPTFGLLHVRLQTWFPVTVQIYVNGHEWLARQMQQKRLGFTLRDNAFTHVNDPAKAQELADGFAQLPWSQILDRFARLVNPLLSEPWMRRISYYWVTDQAEYATDLIFASRQALADLYPQLLEHAVLHFSAPDILRFLGRRLHPRFDGEVLTTCTKDRCPGARIKHRVQSNWLKMYDKFGLILRIETVLNQPQAFKVRRWKSQDGHRVAVWRPLAKGVSNLPHYQQVAQAANGRYLEALAHVQPTSATRKQLDRLCEPVTHQGRRRRGLQPLRRDDQALFLAVLRGEHSLHGFRNKDVLCHLFGTPPNDPSERRRLGARVTRLIQLLRAHGLIAKIPRTRRYRVTNHGHALMAAAVYLRHKAFPKELKESA